MYFVRPGQFADATLRAFVPRNGYIKISTLSKLSVTEYMCQTLPNIGSVWRNHNPVLSSFMTHHWFVTSLVCTITPSTKGSIFILSEVLSKHYHCLFYFEITIVSSLHSMTNFACFL